MRCTTIVLLFVAAAFGQPAQSWLARYTSQNRNDEAWLAAAAPDGGVFVAGWSYGEQAEMLLVRYDSGGTGLWSQRYGGPGSDYVKGLAADDSGRAVVAGQRAEGSNNYDYYVRRHRADGSEDWTRTYDGGTGRHDAVGGVALDAQGNVYVTGQSQSVRQNHDYDCVTIKYSPGGTALWTSRFNRRDSLDDTGAGIAVDATGHAWVCGVSGSELLVLRLRPNGDTAWARTYLSGTQSQGIAVRLDRSGGAVILGTAAPSNNQNFAVLRYDSLGNRTWAQTWDGPGRGHDTPAGLALDGQDNAYACGGAYRTAADFAYATLKYSAAGAFQWASLYNSPDTTGSDAAQSVVADSAGNCYVTGMSWSPTGNHWDIVTVGYNPAGVEQWVDRFDGAGASEDKGRAVVLGRDGSVLVAGHARNAQQDADCVTLRLSPGGTRRWARVHAGAGGPGSSYDCGRFIGRDAAGNLYVTGRVQHGSAGLLKHDRDGRLEWERAVEWGRLSDEPKGLHVTAAGDVYLLSKIAGPGLPNAFFYSLRKYHSNGDTAWIRGYFGPESLGCVPVAMCVDGQENCYITGSSYTTSGGTSWHSVKYRADGSREWAVTTPRPDTLHPLNPPTCIGCDSSGAVFIGGSLDTLSSFFEDMLLVKFNPDGSEAWWRRYDGPGRQFDEARVLAVDAQGNCVVAGYSWGGASGYDIVIARYAAGGDTLWTRREAGPGGLDNGDEPTALRLDAAGDIYVTGRSWADSSMDYLTVKYSAGGERRWTARYDAPGEGTDIPRAIAFDRDGNVYVTGQAWNPGTLWDMVTVSYTPQGVQRWVMSLHAGNYYDEAWDLAVADVDHLYVTGGSAFPGADYDIVTVGYGVPGSLTAGRSPAPAAVTARPNPARSVVVFSFAPGPDRRRFAVNDAAGRIVRRFAPEPGASRLEWDCTDESGAPVAAGVYWLRPTDEPAARVSPIVVVR